MTQVADGSIDFEHVSFRYSKTAKRDALEGVDLHIRSGMTVGILGGTGASKSTLVQLIPRLYDATDGVVKVGGVDVRRYDLGVLRDQVAMVLQKNVLFSGTIAENLRWGNPQATQEELVRVCRLACADEFIQRFPEGYETHLEQGGTNVSGGQKQRLCIARALPKKPRFSFWTTPPPRWTPPQTPESARPSGRRSRIPPSSSLPSGWPLSSMRT